MILLKIHTPEGVESHKVADFPCKIGRALDNDIVIGDESVSSHHAVIDIDASGYILKDIGSTNGIRHKKVLKKEVTLGKPTEVQLGKVLLNLRTSQELSEHTVNMNLNEVRSTSFFSEHPVVATIASVIVLTLVCFISDRFMDPDFKGSKFVGSQALFVAVAAFISGGFAMWAKLQTGRYNFLKLFYLLMMASVFSVIHGSLTDFIAFNLNSDTFHSVWDIVIGTAIVYFLMYAIGKVLFPASTTMKRHIANVVIILAVVGIVMASRKIDEDRFQMAKMSSTIAYPIRSFSKESYGFDNLEKQIGDMDKTLDKQRTEAIKKNEGA